MRQVVLGLGVVTVVLAVWLAREGQWWIAIPDGLFGLGIAWIARPSMHALPSPMPATGPEASLAAEPPQSASAEPKSAMPAAPPRPAPSRPRPKPHRHRRGGRHAA